MQHFLFAGTFDPPTLGHLDIIKRASALCDKLTVAIASNSAKQPPLLTPEERLSVLETEAKPFSNVTVVTVTGLIASYAKEHHVTGLIRGTRSSDDFEFESQMAYTNFHLSGLETLLMPAREHRAISATLIRDLVRQGASLAHFAPASVEEILKHKR